MQETESRPSSKLLEAATATLMWTGPLSFRIALIDTARVPMPEEALSVPAAAALLPSTDVVVAVGATRTAVLIHTALRRR